MRRFRWEVGAGFISVSIHVLHGGRDRKKRILTRRLITELLPFIVDDGGHGFIGLAVVKAAIAGWRPDGAEGRGAEEGAEFGFLDLALDLGFGPDDRFGPFWQMEVDLVFRHPGGGRRWCPGTKELGFYVLISGTVLGHPRLLALPPKEVGGGEERAAEVQGAA
jgi:hypothetical protein